MNISLRGTSQLNRLDFFQDRGVEEDKKQIQCYEKIAIF